MIFGMMVVSSPVRCRRSIPRHMWRDCFFYDAAATIHSRHLFINCSMMFFALLASLFSFRHAIYVSVTEVKPAGQGQWEVSCRLFNNDLEDAIYNQTGKRINLRTNAEVEEHSDLVSVYINSRLKFTFSDGRMSKLFWQGGTAESDAVWASFSCSAGEIAEIENSLLIELFPTQQNVVTLEKGGEKRYYRLSTQQISEAVK